MFWNTACLISSRVNPEGVERMLAVDDICVTYIECIYLDIWIRYS
jgi:hypothetical protein